MFGSREGAERLPQTRTAIPMIATEMIWPSELSIVVRRTKSARLAEPYLVYGILRYQLMIVNAWARRAVAWTLLVGFGSAVVIGVAALPLPFGMPTSGWRLWAVVVVTLLLSGLLFDPFRRLATRIVYPGSFLPDDAAERWRRALAGTDTYAALAARAAAEISAWLQVPIAVTVAAEGTPPANGMPLLRCRHGIEGWRGDPVGWDT